MHGRYPDYDVMAEESRWDDATREVIRRRLFDVPERQFFSEDETATLSAFCDVEMAQDAEPRIPILAYIDEKLAQGRSDGFQYADMPDDGATWQIVARGLDESARERGHTSYAEASDTTKQEIADEFAKGERRGGAWDQVNVARAYSVVTRGILGAFYSHPWAWNEIGYGGPAYPRGYARLGVGLDEAWESGEALDVDPVPDVRKRGL